MPPRRKSKGLSKAPPKAPPSSAATRRKSKRKPKVPLNPEEGTRPLVERSTRSNTAAVLANENPPPSQLHPPVTQPTALALMVDKPITVDDISSIDLNKLLHEAREMGCHFNRAQAATIRDINASTSAQAAPIRDNHASSRPSSRINEEPSSISIGATSRPVSASAQVAPICENHASGRTSSRRNEEPGSTSSEASELQTPATNSGAATTEGGESVDETLVAIAIGLQRACGDMEEVTTSMKVHANPAVDKVLERLKREDDPSTRNLRRMLELIPPQRVRVATAKKPVRVHQVADLRGKWGDGFKVLGKLKDVDQSKWHLQPCDPCPEAAEIRTAANPPVSSSSPMFVMYLIEVEDASSVHRQIPSGYAQESTSAGAPSSTGDEPLGAAIYLKAVIDDEYIRIHERHVVEERGSQGAAFPIIIFARLVKQVCDSLKIPYNKGSQQAKKHSVSRASDQWVSMDDIIEFFGGQTGQMTGPKLNTFANHRSWHLRGETCINQLGEKSDELPPPSQKLLNLMKKILRTPLMNIGEVERERYGSFNDFQRWVSELELLFKK